MHPGAPALTARGSDQEPWRLHRLHRVDGRVREILRALTRENGAEVNSTGEIVWAEHVTQLREDRGTLEVHVSDALARSTWFSVIAAAAGRAWDGEDESTLCFHVAGASRPLALSEVRPTAGPL